jgi:hypothetical protein
MRTHDEKLMESSYKKVYVKENHTTLAHEPLLIWLAKRVGSNVPQDYSHRNLLLRLLKNLISNEQKRKKSKTPIAPISTAQVAITPDSFPSNSTVPQLKKESVEEEAWKLLKDAVTPEELAEVETPKNSEQSEIIYKSSEVISKIFQTLIEKHGMKAYETKDVMDLVMDLYRATYREAIEQVENQNKIWNK